MKQDKIEIEICCGTTCYLLGAAQLLKLEEILPEAWREHVSIRAVPCMERCTREDLGRAPFVKLNGEILANASVETVIPLLTDLMRERGVLS